MFLLTVMSQLCVPVINVPPDGDVPVMDGVRQSVQDGCAARLADRPRLWAVTGDVTQHSSSVVTHL